MSKEQLTKEFDANGRKQLPDTVSKRYLFIPAKVEVEEHHIGIYASKKRRVHHKSVSSKRITTW